jgi:hypothetical protein
MEIGVVGLATHVGLDPAKEPHDFSRGSMSEIYGEVYS